MPIPGQKYNDTKVNQGELKKFDKEFLSIFKPYNVNLFELRILIVNLLDMEIRLMEVMYYVKISLRNQKL